MKNKEQQILNPLKLKWARKFNTLFSPFFLKIKQNETLAFADIKKILIMEYQCIGDFIMLLPVFESIRLTMPDARIDVLCSPAVIPLMKGSSLVDNLIPWTGSKRDRTNCIQALRAREYDLSLNFHGDLRQIWKMYQVKAQYRAGFSFSGGQQWLTHVMDYPYWLHQVERPLCLLEFIGFKVKNSIPVLNHIKADHTFNDVIFLHSGANHSFRLWPEENWQELAMELKKRYKVIWIDDPGSSFCPEGLPHIAGDLNRIACLISAGKLCICCDSMAAHLAAAVDTPVLALFGSQDPSLTKPYGRYAYILTPEGVCTHKRKDWRLCEECMASLSVTEVLSKADCIIKLRK